MIPFHMHAPGPTQPLNTPSPIQPTMDGLIIHEHWLNKILSGKKTWEIRGSRTSKRGEIALIQKGSGKIFGTCKIKSVVGPLTLRDLISNMDKHQIPSNDLSNVLARYTKPYAWVLNDVRQLNTTVAYDHPKGAVRWVKLGNSE